MSYKQIEKEMAEAAMKLAAEIDFVEYGHGQPMFAESHEHLSDPHARFAKQWQELLVALNFGWKSPIYTNDCGLGGGGQVTAQGDIALNAQGDAVIFESLPGAMRYTIKEKIELTDFTLFEEVKDPNYPGQCPKCKGAAYIGFNKIDCKAGC